jgi:phenylalanyl-tRNA synthetase beta chain
MKITLDWLKEHLEYNTDIHTITTLLASLGLPHKKIFEAHESWQEIEIVRIKECAKHPNADKLNLYIIELKNKETKQLVCADQNLKIGDLVPYARDGIKAPSTNKILKVANIRGITSPGMLCSWQDLTLPINIEKNGVLICHEDTKIVEDRIKHYCLSKLEKFKVPIKIFIIGSKMHSDRFKKIRSKGIIFYYINNIL